MFCPKCGGELKQENGFDYVCEKCGASYSFKEKTPEPTAPKVNDSIYGDLTPETMAEDSKTSSDE
ncbi:MAG: hypothetical protein J6U39_02650, partial [Clostridia bacterium]|nr:hypothetical protein [Clostridia bacterium]